MNKFLFLFLSFISIPSWSLYTELGLNYAYKKTFIDNLNNTEQQGTTGSISLYFWERVAFELSYTNSLYVKKEQNLSATSTSIRTTTQIADIYDLEVIYVFADRKAALQPYIKAGAAYISKRQTSQIDNNPAWSVGPYTGTAPSYGVGLKFFLTDSIALRMGYDVVTTPIDNSNSAQDINGRVGLSWIF